jgi:hypothetical protein
MQVATQRLLEHGFLMSSGKAINDLAEGRRTYLARTL